MDSFCYSNCSQHHLKLVSLWCDSTEVENLSFIVSKESGCYKLRWIKMKERTNKRIPLNWMWLLKAVTSWLTKREKEGRQKSVNLDRKYQCLVSQIHLWISSVGFSCCWEDFYKRALPLQYINDLEVTKPTLSYALVIWKTNQTKTLY